MKLNVAALGSRVARRIVLLFIACALLPIVALAVVSYGHVTGHLREESRRRLHHASKAIGMAIYERLLLVEAEMRMLASHLKREGPSRSAPVPGSYRSEFEKRFKGLALITGDGDLKPLFGRAPGSPELTRAESEHVWDGKSVVFARKRSDRPARMFMIGAVDPQRRESGLLIGEIDADYLWGLEYLPPETELIVLGHSGHHLISSLSGAVSIPNLIESNTTRKIAKSFEWTHDGRQYLTGDWSIPLKYAFSAPNWTVVLSEPKARTLAPLVDFRRSFILVLLMSFWVVTFLSILQIRRSMIPLEQLREGTRRLARKEFDARVEVSSGDEFEDLGASFNAMASRLGSQFNTLATISEIDRTILSALDTRTIVETVLARMPDVFPCDAVGVTILDPDAALTGQTYATDGTTGSMTLIETVTITPDQVLQLKKHPEGLLLTGVKPPQYAAPLFRRGVVSVVVLPVFLKSELTALIELGQSARRTHNQEDVAQARQLSDQVAVAISAARLIEELDDLSWGTLIALSRTIDAKSSWTLGHSERAARLAVRIGRIMGLSQKQLDELQRGALLHDIGKIAIPPEILDKPGKLTEEEMTVMRSHPREGARILEPLKGFANTIPVVLQHHEWFDGSGYPDGVSGEAISLIARIYAIADVFDALVSDRPYRRGLDRQTTIDYIKERSGTQFDPDIVPVFLKMMEQDGGQPTDIPSDWHSGALTRLSGVDSAIRKSTRSRS